MDWKMSRESVGLALSALLHIYLIILSVPVLGAPQSSGRILRITTVLLEPYMMARYSRGPGNTTRVTYVGYIADLVRELSEVVGFRYEIYVTPDNDYGYRQVDGTWNGMIRELLVKKADIAAGSMLSTNQRREVVDFTSPFLRVHATVLLRKPTTGSDPNIRFVRDLINMTDITYGTLGKGIIPRTFKRTNDSTLKLIWRNMNNFEGSVFMSTNEEGIERARKEKYAFVIQDTIGDYIAMKKPCDLITLDKFLFNHNYALALRKGSVWLSLLNRGLYELKRRDVFNTLYRKWWIENAGCEREKPSRSISLAATSNGSCGRQSALIFVSSILLWYYGVVKCLCVSV